MGVSTTISIATATDHDPIIDRAFAAWFREADRHGAVVDIPANTSYRTEIDGKEYVVLENCNGILAVYRVRTTGRLKYLRRWPAELAR